MKWLLVGTLVGLAQRCIGTETNVYDGVDPARPAQIVEGSEYEMTLPEGGQAKVFRAKFFLDISLYDGQNMFTNPGTTNMLGLPQDFSILKQTSFEFKHRESGTAVSLDEVYFHHITILPLSMMGAEALSRTEDDPFFEFQPGFAFFINATELPRLSVNAHLLSQKNLKPIKGSDYQARKACNECTYSPTKGNDCTPELSGTFKCCGDSDYCRAGGDCYCETVQPLNKTSLTAYTAELELLVSYETEKFIKVDQLAFAAPKCVSYRSALEEYSANDFCASLKPGDPDAPILSGSFFHQVYENATHPMVKTVGRWLLEHGGRLVWAQPHLHTGGVNATFRLNGQVVCSSSTVYGTDPNATNNARNEYGHLIKIPNCMDKTSHPQGLRFEADDVLEIETIYNVDPKDSRLPHGTGGTHTNVMSMLFTAIVLDSSQRAHLEQVVPYAYSSFSRWDNWLSVSK